MTLKVNSDKMQKKQKIMSYLIFKAEHQETLKKGCAVLDFSAQWCGPCKRMEPFFKKIAEEMKDQAHFFKVDVDDHVELSTHYHISSIPTFVILHDGKETDRFMGGQTEQDLRVKIQQGINKNANQ